MHARCRSTKPGSHNWSYYQGKNIKICARWFDFKLFLEDMRECPEGYTLDRIDSEKDYTPSNCKWATWMEQNNNSSNCRYLEHKGANLSIAAWGRKLGMRPGLISERLRRGWPTEKALVTQKHINQHR